MKQTKILTLERCKCGAYRYIIARDRDRVITFYLQHLFKTQDKTDSKMVQLFRVKKLMLDFHDASITESKRLACRAPHEHEILAEITTIVTKSRLRGKA